MQAGYITLVTNAQIILETYFTFNFKMHLPVDINGFHIASLDKVRAKTKGTGVHSVYDSLREGENCSEQQRLLLGFSAKQQLDMQLTWLEAFTLRQCSEVFLGKKCVEVEPVCIQKLYPSPSSGVDVTTVDVTSTLTEPVAQQDFITLITTGIMFHVNPIS
jgi:hypothetical protein